MDTLIKRRSIIKGQITKLTIYAKSCKDSTSYEEMLTRLEKMKEHYKNFVSVEDEIFRINPEAESDIDAVDDNYYLCVATLQRLMRGKVQTPSGSINESTLNSSGLSPSADFKLPRLSLPTFSGQPREWQSFYDHFKSTVHENTSLSPAQKFQYLIGQLRGPAEILVRHFCVDDASYIEAFQRLVKRYDRKRSIVNEFIDTYINQPQIIKPSAETVGQMYDTCDEVIRGLKALGSGAESRDCWLVHLAEKKLDDITLQLWRQESEQDYPTIDEFLEFLSKRMNSLEGLRKQPIKVQNRHVTQARVFHVNAERKPLPNCNLCSGEQHRLCDCTKFIEMELEQRRQFIKRNSRCYNCLAEGHDVYKCKSRGRCHQCKRRHHTLVHLEPMKPEEISGEQPKSPSATTVLAISDCDSPIIEASPVSSFHSSSRANNLDAILPTAIIEIRDHYGCLQPSSPRFCFHQILYY